MRADRRHHSGVDLPADPHRRKQADYDVEEYLEVFGRPEQVAAWREGRPYVAEVAE